LKPNTLQTLLLAVLAATAARAAAEDCGPPATAADSAAASSEGAVSSPRSAAEDVIEITSEGAEVSRAGDARLLGEVIIRQGERTITAETATFEAATRSFRVEGSVEYSDPRLRIGGATGSWSSERGGLFTEAEFELPQQPARGNAASLQLTPEGNLGLRDVSFTTCPAGNDDWVLRAAAIDIDREAQQGTGRKVRLDFLGMPLIYLPWISFPAGDARKSGFLFPSIGTSTRSGFEFGMPYYFNLAPNYDATLDSRVLTRRGLELGGKFRYLTPRSRGQVDGTWLPDDRLTDSDRSYFRLLHRTDFSSALRFNAQAEKASDSEYFEDFSRGVEGTSITHLERRAGLVYLGRGWRAEALLQNFQTIDLGIDPLDRPYSRLPQLALSGQWPVGVLGVAAGIDAEAVYFDREQGVTGGRLDLAPRLTLPLRGAGWFLEPSAAWRYTGYALEDTPAGSDRSPSRSAPLLSLDAGLVFDRPAGRGGRLAQTLEPRLLYTWIPYRDQSTLPVFDSGLPDLDLLQLFRSNRYVGGDRLGDANQLAIGVTTRLLQADTGRQFLAATIGQKVYFEPPQVTLGGESPERRNASDLVAELELSAYRNWSVDFAMQYDADASNTVLGRAGLQYRPHADSVVNLGYRYREGRIEQWETSVAWKVSRKWSLYGRHVYSARDQQAIDTFAGFEYGACCWRLRVVGRRYLSNRTGEQDTSVALQLELNGLSSVGTSDAFLERGIRGYSRDPAPLP